jgi:hypothetical protein
MSNQPPPGQGSWQQPPPGPPPGQGPGGPPGPPPGPPGPGGPPPPGGPPGGPGGPPPPGAPGGPPFGPGGPPGKSKLPLILGAVGAAIVIVGGGLLLYFLVFNGDDESSGDDYCSLLEENAEKFGSLTEGEVQPETIEEAVSVVHDIRDAAPEEVADEWASIDDPLQAFQQVLDDEGITWEDVNAAQSPDDVPEAVAQAAEEMFNAFEELDMSAINQTIEDHAEEECGIDLQELEEQANQ